MDNVRMLRPAEAAEALGVSMSRLRRLAASGRLVTVRTLGGHRRYREDDVLALQRWMARKASEAEAPADAHSSGTRAVGGF